MHLTLRPILKFHDPLFSQLVRAEKQINWKVLNELDYQRKQASLLEFIQKNGSLKNKFIGILIGSFTEEETAFYLGHQKELNKRILAMIVTRIVSSL